MTVDELQQELFTRFQHHGGKVDVNTLTLLLTIGTTRSKCSRLYDALMRIAARKAHAPAPVPHPRPAAFTELVYLPRDAYYCGGELVPL